MATIPAKQCIYIFGTWHGTKPGYEFDDPTRQTPINEWVPLGQSVQMDNAARLHISVSEMVDFPITISIAQDNTGNVLVYQLGGQATDDMVGKIFQPLILEGTGLNLRNLAIYSTGRCTVCLTAEGGTYGF